MNMQRFFLAIVLMASPLLAAFPSPIQAAPCLLVTLTGTMSGPVLLNGVAGAGTLVRYGDDSNGCSTVVARSRKWTIAEPPRQAVLPATPLSAPTSRPYVFPPSRTSGGI